MTEKREESPLPDRGYFLRRNEKKYGGQLVGGIYVDGHEVQRWTWWPHTAPDLAGVEQ